MSKSYKTILVIKHGALGDIFQALDSFSSLRQSYPAAKIALLTTPAFASLFDDCPWFDEIYMDDRAPFWRLDKLLNIRNLFHKNWDAVIDLQCSKRTGQYHQYFYKHQIGDWLGNAAGCSIPVTDFIGINNRDRMLKTVTLAGASFEEASIDWISAKSMIRIPDIEYCVLVPGCSAAKPSKKWPAERFIALANLALTSGITPILIGTSIDAAAIEEVHHAVPDAINLMGKTNIADLMALAKEAQFVVGNDTGPVFIAARAGSPTIMVMGEDTDPVMSAPFGRRAAYLKDNPISAVSANAVYEKALSL